MSPLIMINHRHLQNTYICIQYHQYVFLMMIGDCILILMILVTAYESFCSHFWRHTDFGAMHGTCALTWLGCIPRRGGMNGCLYLNCYEVLADTHLENDRWGVYGICNVSCRGSGQRGMASGGWRPTAHLNGWAAHPEKLKNTHVHGRPLIVFCSLNTMLCHGTMCIEALPLDNSLSSSELWWAEQIKTII